MKMNLRYAGWLGVVVLLAGCSLVPKPQSDPTRYYVLTGDASAGAVDGGAAEAGSLVLGLKRIEIAPYLDGKDMVVREGGNEIAYQDFARWAEPLTTSIGRELVGSIARADKVGRVYAQPFPFDAERDYDVSIRVLRCEGEKKKGGKAVASFSALIEVTEAKPGGALVLSKEFVAPEAEWDGRDFGELATALSAAVDALGAEVVAALPAE